MTPRPLSRILMVCAGNICRSPYLERRLRQLLGSEFLVTSAGTHAVVGHGIDARMAAALSELGADVEHFTARQLSPDQLTESDLILTATRDQVDALGTVAPGAVTKALTLRHAARIIEAANIRAPGGQRHGGAELAGWLMSNRWLAHSDRDLDDVVDPYGADDAVAADSVDTMEAALQIVAAALRA